jgi:lipoyl(octanoyl) transferase
VLFSALQLFDDPTPRSGALNMALDETLAHQATTPVLRVYRWVESSVSFGYFGVHEEVAARWPGRSLVRRWTGGGEVPHGPGEDFTYTLIVPRGEALRQLGVRESYRAIHAALAPLLPGAHFAEADAAENAACFARPVVADLVLDARKIAGAAQRRGTFGLLHQGSVQGVAWPTDLATQLARALSSHVEAIAVSPTLLASAEALAAEKYATYAWLTRR